MRDRLLAYGVPGERIAVTGFPLPAELVGGAGAQVGLALRVLGGMRDAVRAARWRLALVAGVREDVARPLRRAVEEEIG